MKSKRIFRAVFPAVFLGLLLFSCGESKVDPVQEAVAFQRELNAQFADSEESPLTEEDWLTFESLEFFPVDTAYRVSARLEFHEDSKPFAMQTTTDRLPIYKLYATARFQLKGKDCSLEIYQNQDLVKDPEHSDYLFLPFTDRTNGDSSYGGGRYIDLTIPEGEEITIDFNQSYNPYCAYNSEFSCPIPPRANDLDLEIRAGVKAYGDH
jgi:uncharacterized protein (DUF1684 family)